MVKSFLCEVCELPSEPNPESKLSYIADCCGRIGLCKECAEKSKHDCDEYEI